MKRYNYTIYDQINRKKDYNKDYKIDIRVEN